MRSLRRRFVALVVQLVLLQLGIASGVSACPMHAKAGERATASATRSPNEDRHRAPAPAHSHRHRPAGCTLACATAECAAAGHCASAGDRVRGTPASDWFASDSRAPHARVVAPRSVSSAPEPPPPRA